MVFWNRYGEYMVEMVFLSKLFEMVFLKGYFSVMEKIFFFCFLFEKDCKSIFFFESRYILVLKFRMLYLIFS